MRRKRRSANSGADFEPGRPKESIHGAGSREEDPWLWVYEFRRLEQS